MYSVEKLVKIVGDPIRAEAVLMQHYTAKRQVLKQCDRRYAVLEFVRRYAPVFRRHLEL